MSPAGAARAGVRWPRRPLCPGTSQGESCLQDRWASGGEQHLPHLTRSSRGGATQGSWCQGLGLWNEKAPGGEKTGLRAKSPSAKWAV